MFSKDEAKKIRQHFWTTFGKISARKKEAEGKDKKWITYHTGINAINLKFDFTRKLAMVGIDIECDSLKEQDKYYNRLLGLRKILDSSFPEPLIWNEDFELENGKYIARIYRKLEDVSIYNKQSWPRVFQFFYDNMLIIEQFYLDYRDIIKDPEE